MDGIAVWDYRPPNGLSRIVMESDGEALTALRFEGSRGAGRRIARAVRRDLPVFRDACRWLDVYFTGRQPDFPVRWRLVGATPFREAVVREMLKIPFGATATYGGIVSALARRRGAGGMSAQAVGGAVGWNPICIIIPCHRVIGADGGLTGYGGGLGNKVALLANEGIPVVSGRVVPLRKWRGT